MGKLEWEAGNGWVVIQCSVDSSPFFTIAGSQLKVQMIFAAAARLRTVRYLAVSPEVLIPGGEGQEGVSRETLLPCIVSFKPILTARGVLSASCFHPDHHFSHSAHSYDTSRIAAYF